MAIVKCDSRTQMKDVTLRFLVGSPTIGKAGQQFAVGIELRQTVEQQRDHLARRHICGQRRIERTWVVGFVVDEPPQLVPAARLCMAGSEKTEEQGARRGVEKVDSAEQVSQHSQDWQIPSIARRIPP